MWNQQNKILLKSDQFIPWDVWPRISVLFLKTHQNLKHDFDTFQPLTFIFLSNEVIYGLCSRDNKAGPFLAGISLAVAP